jgi:hypothetical protein
VVNHKTLFFIISIIIISTKTILINIINKIIIVSTKTIIALGRVDLSTALACRRLQDPAPAVAES